MPGPWGWCILIEATLTWDAVVNAIGAAAMVGFGVWVLTLHPRTRSMQMLALFSIAYGAIYIVDNLLVWSGWELYAIWNPTRGALYVAAAWGLLGLVHEVLGPLGDRAQGLWRMILGVTVAMAAIPLALTAAWGFPALGADVQGWETLSVLTFRVPYHLYLSAFFALPLAFAWLYRHPSEGYEDATRTQAVLVSGPLVLWPALYAGSRASWLADPTTVVNSFPVHAAMLVVGFLGVGGSGWPTPGPSPSGASRGGTWRF